MERLQPPVYSGFWATDLTGQEVMICKAREAERGLLSSLEPSAMEREGVPRRKLRHEV